VGWWSKLKEKAPMLLGAGTNVRAKVNGWAFHTPPGGYILIRGGAAER
jgi:hypothetical protein